MEEHLPSMGRAGLENKYFMRYHAYLVKWGNRFLEKEKQNKTGEFWGEYGMGHVHFLLGRQMSQSFHKLVQ